MSDKHIISPLFRLPLELRLNIYEDILGCTKARPLYIQRHVWSWNSRVLLGQNERTKRCHNLLVVCRQMYNDVIEVLYRRHELQLYTTCEASQQTRITHQRICGIEDYASVLLRVRKLRLTLFLSSNPHEADALLALMGYLKTILAERESPLQVLNIEMCAMDSKHCKSTAVLYAAQGFRSFGKTSFHFQCGFSGVGSESAMQALMQHANEKEKGSEDLSKEEALEKLDKAWKRTLPSRWNPKVLSNSWLQTTFEV